MNVETTILLEYQELVLDYLDHIGYPEYILDYHPEDVAKSITKTVVHFKAYGVSHRMCAIVIFALTLHKINNQVVKH